MADSNPPIVICVVCTRSLRHIQGHRKRINSVEDIEFFSRGTGKRLQVDDVICSSCRTKSYKRAKKDEVPVSSDDLQELCVSLSQGSLTDQSGPSQSSVTDPTFNIELPADIVEDPTEYMEVPISRTVSTHKYCCICSGRSNLTVVPDEARTQSFAKSKIYIPANNRCCRHHLIKKRFYDDDLKLLKIYSHYSMMTSEEIKQTLTSMSDQCNLTLFDKLGNFNLSSEQITVFTGLNWENIEELRSMMSSMRDSATRTATQAIIVFLMKLRTGNSNKMISSILQLESEQLVSHYVLSVINSFQKDVLPSRFGLNALSRTDLIANNTAPIAANLYGFRDKLIIICDGTYAYHQKSSNNLYQRKSFSGHKKLPLCKPFTICTTNGYVVDMLGPYEANMNDAEILKLIIQQPQGLCDFMQKGDVFILDRGFRDVKPYLQDKEYVVLMPALKGSQKQLNTKDSNDSRFVTKLRWVVEAVHGMIKSKNNLLGHKVDNKILPNIGAFYRIAAFLLNQFGKRLNSDTEISSEIVEQMISRKDTNNTLGDLVEEKGWLRKRLPFDNISSADLHDFPELTEKELKILFTGTYQYSQAISYLSEMMDGDGTLNLQFLKEQSNILKLQVQSRHISRKVYRCFIEYVPDSNSRSGILRYFCECANGRRTVGCCSHVASIIYYLSYARYLSKIPRPAEQLSTLFQITNVTPVIADESGEE